MRFVHFKLVGPVILAILLVIAGLASFPYLGIARIDDAARSREETLVKRNIGLWISDIEFSLTAWTIWDEAIAKIDNQFDPEWTDRNIGSSLIGTSRTRFAAIVDAADTMIYAKSSDEVLGRPFFIRGATAIVRDAEPLVREVRNREMMPAQPGIPAKVSVSRIEVLDGDAVLLSASLFQPDFGTSRPKGRHAPVLITAMPIGNSLEDFFGTRFLLDDARIGTLGSVATNRARVEIAIGVDGERQVLSWRPPTPATDIFYKSLPLIVAVAIVLLAGGIFTIRISQTTARVLVARERQMRHAATHDFLTGLANRARLEPEFSVLAGRGNLAVACLDLDGFKAVNDTRGHAKGDELLKVVAARLKAGTRSGDRVFRLGGDEFAILMPATSLAEAETLCAALSASLSAPVMLDGHAAVVGASFGLEWVANGAISCDVALGAADAALYQAKARGRGSVVTAAELQSLPDSRPAPRLACARG